jgi:hypothetical protein
LYRRATGQLITPATWIRQFVQSHPAYQHDSVVRPEIAHDLLMACKGIGEGSVPCVEILGEITIDRYALHLHLCLLCLHLGLPGSSSTYLWPAT